MLQCEAAATDTACVAAKPAGVWQWISASTAQPQSTGLAGDACLERVVTLEAAVPRQLQRLRAALPWRWIEQASVPAHTHLVRASINKAGCGVHATRDVANKAVSVLTPLEPAKSSDANSAQQRSASIMQTAQREPALMAQDGDVWLWININSDREQSLPLTLPARPAHQQTEQVAVASPPWSWLTRLPDSQAAASSAGRLQAAGPVLPESAVVPARSTDDMHWADTDGAKEATTGMASSRQQSGARVQHTQSSGAAFLHAMRQLLMHSAFCSRPEVSSALLQARAPLDAPHTSPDEVQAAILRYLEALHARQSRSGPDCDDSADATMMGFTALTGEVRLE